MKNKSKKLIEDLKTVFPKQIDRVSLGKCPICGSYIKIEDFKDPLSLKEFNISGMCQECQDKIFN